jgi:predicted  nucleic acid-binding Zn-ribbon protein
MRDASSSSREDAAAAAESVSAVEQKLTPLLRIQELTTSTEEKLAHLNALAEHVMQKTKALESQKHTLDRAAVESNRLNEMVWTMDIEMSRLQEGLKEAVRTQETVARIEKLTEETEQKVDLALRMRNELSRDVVRFERDGRALVETLAPSLETLGIEKTQIEALDERLRMLQTGMAHAENRMATIAASEAKLAGLQQEITVIAGRFEGLSIQADELAQHQGALDSLHDRLMLVEDLAKQTSIRYDSLRQSRVDLEGIRRDIVEVHRAQNDVAQLRDRLAADRSALEAFGARMIAFRGEVPGTRDELAQITGRLNEIEAAKARATQFEQLALELDAQLTRMAGRQPFVDALGGAAQCPPPREHRRRPAHGGAVSPAWRSRCRPHDGRRRDRADAGRAAAARCGQRAAAGDSAADRTAASTPERSQRRGRRGAKRPPEETAVLEQRSRLEALLEENRALESATGERVRQYRALAAQPGTFDPQRKIRCWRS